MVCTIASNRAELLWTRKNEHEMPYTALKQIMLQILWHLYENGYTEFCVNCEYGIPLWTAELICAMKLYHPVKLHCILPSEEQSSYWPEAYRERYFAVQQLADTVVFAGNSPDEACRRAADRCMVQRSDLVLLFADRTDALYIADYAAQYGVTVRFADGALQE